MFTCGVFTMAPLPILPAPAGVGGGAEKVNDDDERDWSIGVEVGVVIDDWRDMLPLCGPSATNEDERDIGNADTGPKPGVGGGVAV